MQAQITISLRYVPIKKACLFGDVNNLSICGKIAESELIGISSHFEGVKIDKYVIMPNHVHAIIVIGCDGEAERLPSAGDASSIRPAGRHKTFPALPTIIGLINRA